MDCNGTAARHSVPQTLTPLCCAYTRSPPETNAQAVKHLRELLTDNTITFCPYEVRACSGTLKHSSAVTRGCLLALQELEQIEDLGAGGFGRVILCNWLGTDVAVKVMHKSNGASLVDFLREARLMSQLRHPHIVQFLGVCINAGKKAVCCGKPRKPWVLQQQYCDTSRHVLTRYLCWHSW